MNRKRSDSADGFTLVELLVVIVIIAILAALLLPAISRALCAGRHGAMKHLIDNLQQASKNYEMDQNQYPPGDGTGSADLADALSSATSKKVPYFEFRADLLATNGSVASLIRPGDILNYRNNQPKPAAGAHNKSYFDLWTPDCRNVADGCNNWE